MSSPDRQPWCLLNGIETMMELGSIEVLATTSIDNLYKQSVTVERQMPAPAAVPMVGAAERQCAQSNASLPLATILEFQDQP